MRATVVGAGLAGITAARLLKDAGWDVEIFERRGYIGGNCSDHLDSHGVHVHEHGPHIFHTDNEMVWEFVTRFAEFNDYQHKVLANLGTKIIPIPVNDISVKILGWHPSSEEIVDLVFKDYSEKMWGKPWGRLPSSVTGRVPAIRKGDDCRYFLDPHQGVPKLGYTKWLTSMLGLVPVHLGEDNGVWHKQRHDLVVYTGSIDEYFGVPHTLPYRTVDIQFSYGCRLPAAVVNECNPKPHTRTTDYAWFSQVDTDITVQSKETPREYVSGDIPIWPVHTDESLHQYEKFAQLTDAKTVFLGRLGTYRYMDMDDIVYQAMTVLEPYLSLRD